MKRIQLASALFALFILFLGAERNPNNPPVGNTGAPGEQTCQRSGCHSGGAFTGNVAISGVPDTVYAGITYPVTLTLTSNATRGGFQMTCLNSTNAACGTFATATGVSIGTGGGKQYPRQSTPKTLSGGAASWTFNWTAPASLPNPAVSFYFASLAANGNGNDSGDNVFTASKTVVFGGTSADEEPILADWLDHQFKNDQLHIRLNRVSRGTLKVFTFAGAEVMSEQITEDQLISTAHLSAGIYLVHVNAGGKTKNFKILVP
jgi:hypothetical protein